MDASPAASQSVVATHARSKVTRRPKAGRFARATAAALSALALSANTLLSSPTTVHAGVSADVNAGMTLSLEAPAPLMASSFEQAVVDLVNRDRLANGVGPLEFDPALLPTARQRAADQVPQPALNHYDPAGQLAFVNLLSRDGVEYRLAGENLARLYGLDDSAAFRAEDALMHSPTHRANILEPTFNHVAIGATADSQGRVIVAQIFRAA